MQLDVQLLAYHIRSYESRSAKYDEIFDSTSNRIREHRSADKQDLAALAFWKRLNCNARWVTSLLNLSDFEVEAVTGEAFQAAQAQDRFSILAARLPGCRNWGPYASTILCAYEPENYAVRDRRAITGLKRLGCPIKTGVGLPVRYHERILQVRDTLRQEADWSNASARQVDKGLFDLGG